MESVTPAIKYLLILFGTFAVSHVFFGLVEKADRLPTWLNPLRAALIVTFLVQLWLMLNASREPAGELP